MVLYPGFKQQVYALSEGSEPNAPCWRFFYIVSIIIIHPPFIYIKTFGTNFPMKPKLLSRQIHYEENIINIFRKSKPKNGQPD